MTINDIYAGKPDAKDEIITEGYNAFLESYIEPNNFNIQALLNQSSCFISGFKGTGKTALLYYLEDVIKKTDEASYTSYIFFKGDYSEIERQTMDITAKRLVSTITITNDIALNGNDFEYIWKWLFYQRIWEDNSDCNFGLFYEDDNWKKFSKIIDSINSLSNKRKLNIPKKLKLGCAFTVGSVTAEPNLEVDFTKPDLDKTKAYKRFVEYVDELETLFLHLNKTDIPYFIFVDELEAFYGEQEIFYRDLRLIRDLIFTVKKINISMMNKGNFKIICSVRREILNSINRFIVSKELNKITSGFDVPLVWNYNNTNSFEHPIIKILTQRIIMSERKFGNVSDTNEIIKSWFPEKIDDFEPATYILNHSWNKPRDIVRLILAAKSCLCRNNSSFNQATFDMLRKVYSQESLDEIREEMRALYGENDIDTIISCLTGFRVVFTMENLQERIDKYYSSTIWKTELNKILDDIYRLGIIGNYSRLSKSHRWQHKGDDQLIISDEWAMMIHPALQNALSVSTRHDNGLNKAKNTTERNINKSFNIGDRFEVQILKDCISLYVVKFEYGGQEYKGTIFKKYLLSKYQNCSAGKKLFAKIMYYDTEYKKWVLTVDE